jgi:hypothetical protein
VWHNMSTCLKTWQCHSETSPLKEQEKKRPRRNRGAKDDSDSSMNRSALSFEESDRAQ